MTLFDSLAKILTYPDGRYADAIGDAFEARTLESEEPLSRFAESVRGLSVVQLQELYIQTFDLNPVCALEIGWHLFGENYDRGILLVRMRALLDKHGVRESTELPDHLTHALRLIDRMSDEDALDFAAACVVPALHKMREAIVGNPYEPVIDAILRVLYARFPELPLPLKRETSAPHPVLRFAQDHLLPPGEGSEGDARRDLHESLERPPIVDSLIVDSLIVDSPIVGSQIVVSQAASPRMDHELQSPLPAGEGGRRPGEGSHEAHEVIR